MNAIEGPAADLFVLVEPAPDELFSPAVQSPEQMRLDILEARINELYDFIMRICGENYTPQLLINAAHRHPLSNGLHAQDTSRIPDIGTIK